MTVARQDMSDRQRRIADARHDMRVALSAEFAALVQRLARLREGEALPSGPALPETETSGLAMLTALFGLEPADRDLLTIAAGAELEPAVAEAVRALTGGDRPDVSLAMALTGEPGWDSLCPEAPLRRWRLLDLGGSGPMLRRTLIPDERVLHFLMGVNYLDTRLESIARLVEPNRGLDAREARLAQRIEAAWCDGRTRLPLLLLAGHEAAAKREVAAHGAAGLGLRLFAVAAADLPTDAAARGALATLLDREAILTGAAIMIEAEDEEASIAARLSAVLGGPTLISAVDPLSPEREPRLRLELRSPDRRERRALWRQALGLRADALGPGLDRLAEQFALDRGSLGATVEAATIGTPVAPEALFDRIWQAARAQGRRHLDGLAERVEGRAVWEDLVLPAETKTQLRDLAGHVREAWRVNRDWGWAAKGERGLGAAALFAGPSGTGKTLAAEVLAGELGLDLYRIDLSQVVSKYIGETEKNLARIFQAAEDGGAILLFDEADALFGKRSEVKDSHDRYANVEVSYLLQRMEAYRGLAVLTTNLKGAVDQAFLRRLRYVVSFPFPDAAARAEIWARIFPSETPLEGLDPTRLARLNVTGGAIRSIALNAAFLAAAEGGPLRPAHVLTAARREYAKLEKPFTQAEQGAFP